MEAQTSVAGIHGLGGDNYGKFARNADAMIYEPTPKMTEEEVQANLLPDNPALFAAALRSAAMYLPGNSLDRALASAVDRSRTAINEWAISQAIIVSIQARGYVPAHAADILATMPDSVYSFSRDEALGLVSKQIDEPNRTFH